MNSFQLTFADFKIIIIVILAICLSACAGRSTPPEINTGKVNYNCNFDIHQYLQDPQGYNAKGLAQAFNWLRLSITRGLNGPTGKILGQSFESQWIKKNEALNVIWHIGSDHTVTKKSFIVIYKGQHEFVFAEIPEKDLARFDLQADESGPRSIRLCPIVKKPAQ